MNQEFWKTVWDVSQRARSVPLNERTAFIQANCSDPQAAAEVEALLAEASLDGSRAAPAQKPIPAVPGAGSRIGRYTIEGLLGRGAMGNTFRAQDEELGRPVAIKILHAWQEEDEGWQRSIREARAASALNHPNIVMVFDVLPSDFGGAIVMELVSGQTLRHWCRQAQPLAKVTPIGHQLALALEAAHRAGIIHRDMKPENVMVRDDGYVKLLDFGLARSVGGTASTGDSAGTLQYMSPEQARAERLTPATDIFSLGIILFELLTGTHPFGGRSNLETLSNIVSGKPPQLGLLDPKIPASLTDLIGRMLSLKPEGRPTAPEVVKVLAALGSQGPPSTGASLARRGYWWLAAAALVAAAGAVWVFSRQTPPDNPSLTSRPLTSRPEIESEPAVSADGKWVAFLSTDKPENPPRLYWQAADGDSPTALEAPGTFLALAWTPDGKQLTGMRANPGKPSSIVSIDPRTQIETRLGDTLSACEATGLDWSPDGRELAFPDCAPGSARQSIYILNPQSGERRKLTSPPDSGRGDNRPRFSPDGRRVAFKREVSPGVEDVYSIPVGGGAALRITSEERTIAGLDWMPDGQSLVVSSLRRGSIYALWRYPASGQGEPRLMTQAGMHAITPGVGKKSRRLIWVSQNVDVNIWSVAASGNGKPNRLVASTRRDQDPDSSRDGSRLAFRSVRTGASEIWVSNADGSQAFRATNLRGPVTGTPTWSTDGRRLAFDSRPGGNPDIYMIECAGTRCGEAKRLTDDPGADVTPDWSADGQHLYFASVRTGRKEIWRISPEAPTPERVTRNGGLQPRESPDGKWLYYAKEDGRPTLWRIPGPKSAKGLSPGEEEKVLTESDGAVLSSADWVPSNDEVYFAANETGLPNPVMHTIRACHVGTRKFRRVAAPGSLVFSFGLSSDLRQILFCRADRAEANIMVSDGIR